MKKTVSLILCIVLALSLLVGCTSSAPKTKIALNEVTHSVFYAPLYAAIKLGFFADEGLDVELSNGGGADKVMTAVLTGQADIGLAGPEACIYVYSEGRENYPVVFAQLTKRDGSFLVGRTKTDAFDWTQTKGKTIIGGRKGGMPEMTLEYVMRKNGVVPQADAIVDTSVQFNMMAGAFTGGNGDFVTLFEPTATQIELEGKGFVVTSIGQDSGEIPYTAFFASQDYIAANGDTVQRFTNAMAKGQRWVQSHSADDIAEAVADQFPDTDLTVLTLVAQRYKDIDAWNDTPVMKEEALTRLQTVMETAGELEHRVEFSDLVNNTFAEKAAK